MVSAGSSMLPSATASAQHVGDTSLNNSWMLMYCKQLLAKRVQPKSIAHPGMQLGFAINACLRLEEF
jgi:hypothetical protein